MNQLIQLLLPLLMVLGLLLPRWLLVITFVPAFSASVLPTSVRYSIAIALSLPLLPAVLAQIESYQTLSVMTIAVLAVKEAALGLLLGILLAIPFWIFESVGTYLDNQRGGNPQAVNPLASPDASVSGLMLQQGLVIALIRGGVFMSILAPVYQSFSIWPPLTFFPNFTTAQLLPLIQLLVQLMSLSLIIVSPCLILLVLIEIAFGIAARWSPQLPAYTAALPIKTLIAVLMLVLCLPTLWQLGQDLVLRQTHAVTVWMQTIPARAVSR